MAEYYLISQLPSLDGLSENTPVPISEERFADLCGSLLGPKTLGELKKLTLVPSKEPDPAGSSLVRAWNEGERQLRFALGKARADKMGKAFDLPNEVLPVEACKAANAAAEIENPLEAENFLLQYRLRFLETLRPMEPFSEEFLFYYALKLKLILRIRRFDSAVGAATYKNIYNSVLNGDRVEA